MRNGTNETRHWSGALAEQDNDSQIADHATPSDESEETADQPEAGVSSQLAEALFSELQEDIPKWENEQQEAPQQQTEQPSQDVAPLHEPKLVRVGDDVYDYDFVEAAVAEAEKVSAVAQELEQELAQVQETRRQLEELNYLLKAIQGRLGDPVFYRDLQALLEGKRPESWQAEAAPETARDDVWAEPQPQQPVATSAREQQPAPNVLAEMINQNIQQAVVPLYAAYAREAGERFADDLERRYNVKLSPEERVQLRNRAIDRGDFRSDHLFGEARENPLEAAFFEIIGPKLLKAQQDQTRREEQKKSLPEQGQHSPFPSEQLASSQSAKLAKEFLRLIG